MNWVSGRVGEVWVRRTKNQTFVLLMKDKPNEFFKNKISESSVSMSLNGRIPPNHLG